MTQLERTNRIVARGEVSGHSHIIVGEAIITHDKTKILVDVVGPCAIKHLLEEPFVKEGKEIWTKEHNDITLEVGKYEIIQQQEYNPYEDSIRKVQD